VRSDQTFRIPLIDFSKYRHATSLSEKRKTADEVVNGFKEVGFIYLEGHGIPSSTVDGVFRKVRVFQARYSFIKITLEIECRIFPLAVFRQSRCTASPQQVRPFALTMPQDKLAWEDPRSNRGYVKFGRERVTQSSDPAEIAELRKKAPDSKETMEIGHDLDNTWKNQWPREGDVPEFKQTMLSFFQVRDSALFS
jgi:isopenicillin N synthase-like dioxygenase